MRVLVCGGRLFRDRDGLYDQLDALHGGYRISLIIQGCASGADSLAADWANERGVEAMDFPADWKRHGKAAGPIRNQRMLDEGLPDLVVAFPGGKGTADMVRRAGLASVSVLEASTASARQRPQTQPSDSKR